MGSVPRVSLLVPVYNRATYLLSCLESISAQRFADIEIVAVDNASTDSSWELLLSYGRREPRLRSFRNPSNLGPVGNWRRCAELARAPVAGLVFSDDVLDPGYVEHLLPALDDPHTGFACALPRIGTPEQSAPSAPPACGTGAVDSAAYLRSALVAADTPVSPGAALFRSPDLRRNLAVDLPVPSRTEMQRTGAGIDLWLYLDSANCHARVAISGDHLVLFRDHPGSLTRLERPLVTRQYSEVRLLAARRCGDASLLAETAAAAWLAACRHRRRPLSPHALLGTLGLPQLPAGFFPAAVRLCGQRFAKFLP